jgi:Domain of unknown function (DU1801)
MPHQFTQTTNSVLEYLNNYENQKVIPDCFELITIMSRIMDCEPVLWCKTIGFGKYHYRYESGREGDSFILGFSPSKVGITIYTNCYLEPNTELISKLGKHKASKACIYIKKLEDIDLEILEQLLKYSITYMKKHYDVE